VVRNNQSVDRAVAVRVVAEVQQGVFVTWFKDADTEKVLNAVSIWIERIVRHMKKDACLMFVVYFDGGCGRVGATGGLLVCGFEQG
jgi:hypothetical protein